MMGNAWPIPFQKELLDLYPLVSTVMALSSPREVA
jgi:hypothetical protein